MYATFDKVSQRGRGVGGILQFWCGSTQLVHPYQREQERAMAFKYTVQKGDTLSEIAERFGVALKTLEAANPQIKNPDLIFPGQVIIVPTPQFEYIVQKGDTLSEIAERFGVSLKALEAANPQIKNPDLIFPGQHIHIP